MTIHEKIRRLCEDRSKIAVARRAGLPRMAIHNLLFKAAAPSGERALKIARALNVSVDWLLDDAQGWPPVWANAPEHTTVGAA